MSAFVIGETTNNKHYSSLLKTRVWIISIRNILTGCESDCPCKVGIASLFRNSLWASVPARLLSCQVQEIVLHKRCCTHFHIWVELFWKQCCRYTLTTDSSFTFTTKHSVSTTWRLQQHQYYSENKNRTHLSLRKHLASVLQISPHRDVDMWGRVWMSHFRGAWQSLNFDKEYLFGFETLVFATSGILSIHNQPVTLPKRKENLESHHMTPLRKLLRTLALVEQENCFCTPFVQRHSHGQCHTFTYLISDPQVVQNLKKKQF